ncbi:MAG TPA: rod shape-determining protein MreC [Candidatus Angelobacter sp.]|nr:rod shape-determining protein MreC [Candidatus Angelobacter sp.]
MENFFSRYKNPLVLMAVLFIQVIALATQVKARGPAAEGPPLIRVWTVTAITPFERALIATSHFFRNTWNGYVDLRKVHRQNRDLQEELGRLRLENARLKTDVEQNRRLQALLDFKEQYVGQTIAAQVIGSGGSEQSHVIYIDKHKDLKPGMAVITPDGIVGKIKEVYPMSSQVVLISDRDSGAGVILENSRLQGVLHGSDLGDLRVDDIMSDEKVDVGERVMTSGGDRVYPKGLPVGIVNKVGQDSDGGPFLSIRLKPAADLNRLEEVLVVTSIAERTQSASSEQPRRAADILAQKLPSIPKPTPTPEHAAAKTAAAGSAKPSGSPTPAAGKKKTEALITASPAPATATKKIASPKQPAAAETPEASPSATPEAQQRRDPEKPPR